MVQSEWPFAKQAFLGISDQMVALNLNPVCTFFTPFWGMYFPSAEL
jgi:hypothetical protein